MKVVRLFGARKVVTVCVCPPAAADVENAEEMVLKGIENLLINRKIKHFVMETRPNQADFVKWFFEIGYRCMFYNTGEMQFWDTAEKTRAGVLGRFMGDIYCNGTFPTARPNSSRRRLAAEASHASGLTMPARGLRGIYNTGSGWT